MIKMVPRGVSSTADAYLTPILGKYLEGFFTGFDERLKGRGAGAGGRAPAHLPGGKSSEAGEGQQRNEGKEGNQDDHHNPRVEFMGSDGGLLDLNNFSGLKSILSGPAGGVVGYALTSWDEKRKTPIIGYVSMLSQGSCSQSSPSRIVSSLSIVTQRIDVGGTSTDVSRYAGRYEIVYETTTAGITVSSPQLDINTVAAGGGSCLSFKNGLFKAGPESAGADPGPACYRCDALSSSRSNI
jgi:5-oxoprolinase (ATP-hydrolysing)